MSGAVCNPCLVILTLSPLCSTLLNQSEKRLSTNYSKDSKLKEGNDEDIFHQPGFIVLRQGCRNLSNLIEETPQIGSRIQLSTFTNVVLYVVGITYRDQIEVELNCSPHHSLRIFYEDYAMRTGESVASFI